MDIDTEIAALQIVLKSDPNNVYVTKEQVGGVIGLLRPCLVDQSRDTRIAVLRCLIGGAMWDIAGVHVNSTTNMTSHVARVLITQFRDETSEKWRPNNYAKELLHAIEERVAAHAQAASS